MYYLKLINNILIDTIINQFWLYFLPSCDFHYVMIVDNYYDLESTALLERIITTVVETGRYICNHYIFQRVFFLIIFTIVCCYFVVNID